jgi:dienelactone hydrolase
MTRNSTRRLQAYGATAAMLLACPAAAAAEPVAPPPVETPGLPATTPLGSGPYRAIMESDPGLPTHTVYRPAELAALGAEKLPVVAWANGGCQNAGNRFRWLLSEVASYGFLVVAIGPIGATEAEAAPRAPPAGQTRQVDVSRPPPAQTHPSQLIDAINWALAENQRPGGRYQGRLDTSKIGVMGQSCGGVQAIEASADPRVSTTMVWNSGLFPVPTTLGGGKPMSKADLERLHAPTAYISGDAQDVAFPNANDDFERISAIPVFRGYERGVGHVGTYRESNGGEFGGVAVAWLKWRLKGDLRAGKMFAGADCGLCVNPRWVIRKKRID